MSLRGSNPLLSWPTIGIVASEPIPRGGERQAGLEGRVAEQRLQEDGQQFQAAVVHEAQHSHETHAGSEGKILRDAQVDNGMRRAQLANDHRH